MESAFPLPYRACHAAVSSYRMSLPDPSRSEGMCASFWDLMSFRKITPEISEAYSVSEHRARPG